MIIFLLALPAIALLSAPAGAVTLADVERALAATTTMTADFSQTAATGQVARGTMVLKRPGRIRFDYAGKTPYLVVSDGRTLSFVDYQVSQVSQWPVRSTPLGVLLEPKADLARVARVLPEAQSPLPGQVAVMAEDPKKPDLGRILFFLLPDRSAPGGLLLTGWRVTDAQNKMTTVQLSNIRTNIAVSNSRFAFRDPRQKARPPGRGG
ncbi:MAG: outer-membrane lipoprotein carrier protein LolA [Sandarakinorhabdus sp.]|nr:outer-membrane lipoprotein carrier protein LolA [Sandarakinorhabdus sp.]